MSYEYFDHTADVGFIVRAESLERLFEESAEALMGIMLPLETIECKIHDSFSVTGDSLEDLLYDFLSEFLYLLDAENMIFKKFEVEIDEGNPFKLFAKICGEKVDPKRHIFESYVKAITYHGLEVKKRDDVWSAKVIVDI
jgi:SHS2 domain-containing protein